MSSPNSLWTRRSCLKLVSRLVLGSTAVPATAGVAATTAGNPVRLFLCGDVMTGRGIDQILAHPSRPELFEPMMHSALGYVRLAEDAHGPIPRMVPWPYVWGEALAEFDRRRPHARIVNLETAVTRSDEAWPKGINYRMNPDNTACLSAAGVDCCVLSNNHVIDWGRAGLAETLETLHRAGIRTAGAGADLASAQAPAVLPVGEARVLVFAAAALDSGVPADWAAAAAHAGVHLLPDLSGDTLRRIGLLVAAHRRPGDLVVFSVHWGGNWGFGIPARQRDFARGLIDHCAVDLVHGHSSHHVKGIEVHQGRLILYGCGDLLDDYEGIGGYEAYRGDLGLMYFPTLHPDDGRLSVLEMVPTHVRRMRVERATGDDRQWLYETLKRECGLLGTSVEQRPDGSLALRFT